MVGAGSRGSIWTHRSSNGAGERLDCITERIDKIHPADREILIFKENTSTRVHGGGEKIPRLDFDSR